MKPDWDKLSAEYEDSKVVVIGDVDCTVHEDVCGEHGVQGYPTIKYYLGGEPEDYDGGRSLSDLKKFVEGNLMDPACDSLHKDACTPEQLKSLEEAMAMSESERKELVDSVAKGIKAANAAHEKLVEGLQKSYEESQKKTEETIADLKKSVKWVKAVKKAAGKEEL